MSWRCRLFGCDHVTTAGTSSASPCMRCGHTILAVRMDDHIQIRDIESREVDRQ